MTLPLTTVQAAALRELIRELTAAGDHAAAEAVATLLD